jgi:flagellar motor switch protein FliN
VVKTLIEAAASVAQNRVGKSMPLAGLENVEVRVTVELGGTVLSMEEVAALGAGAKVRIDRMADDPVDIKINGKLYGHGKLVVVGDSYGVQVTEIITV